MDDLKTFCCQNPPCRDYGRRGLDNLRVCFRNGPNQQRRVLACRTCQARFSERKGTALYRAKLPQDKALAVLQHLQESCGVRQTSRLVGVNKNAVLLLARPSAMVRSSISTLVLLPLMLKTRLALSPLTVSRFSPGPS